MFLEFISEYQNVLLASLKLLFFMPIIMLFSLWSSPGHREEYEKCVINLSDYNEEQRIAIIKVRESLSLVKFLSITLFSITITAYIILFLEFLIINVHSEFSERIINLVGPYNNFIVIIFLFFVGILNEKIYVIMNYEDYLKPVDKKLALYLVTLIMSFALLNRELFIIIFGIFTGKFIWIDTYLEINIRNIRLKRFLVNKIKQLNNDHIRKETIRFCGAILTSSMVDRIISSFSINNSYISILPIITIVLWYIKPIYNNIKNISKN